MGSVYVHQVAKAWITQHGSDAEALALSNAMRCLDQGDYKGSIAWILIALAIEDLSVGLSAPASSLEAGTSAWDLPMLNDAFAVIERTLKPT